MMAMPYWVVDRVGNWTAGYWTKAEADAGCKEMNDYAGEAYWQVWEP